MASDQLSQNQFLSMTTDELAEVVGGTVLFSGESSFHHFGTDTRKELTGRLFIALKGDYFDAHEFLDSAVKAGASCLLVHDAASLSADDLHGAGVVMVDDTLVALQALAKWWRRECGFQVVGITGSNGKTTTKTMALALIGDFKKTHAAKGSFNNHWGVPFTILEAPRDTEVLILEMGMNALGEIQKLCHLAEPDVVVCTMVGTAHIGELGSQENIVKAKWEIYEHSPNAKKVFNFDNKYTLQMYEMARQIWLDDTFILFSCFRKEADIFLRATSFDLEGLDITGVIQECLGETRVEMVGRQNMVNLGAAAGVALAIGMTPKQVWDQVPNVKGEWGRNQIIKSETGATILFDGYNANPDSMGMLVKNLLEIYLENGKKVAVLGEMFELGQHAAEMHKDLGEMVGSSDFEVIWFVGPSALHFEAGLKAALFNKTYFISETYEESLASKIGSMLNNNDIVVVKGSRGMKMERVVNAFQPIDFDLKS